MTDGSSPFPPIADYAFLSDCHTGALVAPDGSVDWLCVPAFDSPSAFGNLLDRGAGSFRFGPYGINVPTARTYVPGTNVLTTTWHTPGGWIVVHDALTMGPRQGPDLVTPHTRPPSDWDAEHLLVRTVECLEGSVEVELVCEPAFDYGRTPAEWSLVEEGHAADASGAGSRLRLVTDMFIGVEGSAARARHVLTKGERAFCALSWADGLTAPTATDDAVRTGRLHGRLLAQLAGPGPDPRPPAAAPAGALGADHQGADVHADRCDGGRADHLAARDAGRRAQLGLPLHLDAGLHVHAAGAALPQPGLGGRRVHAVRGRPGADRGRQPADHVRHRRPPGPDRVDPRRPVGIRGRPPGADRQRRLRPAAERRLRRRPGLPPAAHPTQPAPAATAVAVGRVPGRVRDGGVAPAGPGHLGGPRRSAALRVVQADVLGRTRPGGQAGRDPRRRRAGGEVVGDGGGDPGRHPGPRRQRRRGAASALRHRRPGRVGAAGGHLRLPPRHRRADAQHRHRGRPRPHRARLRPPLQDRRDRRRAVRQGGHVPDLLVLAGVGARRGRRDGAGDRP